MYYTVVYIYDMREEGSPDAEGKRTDWFLRGRLIDISHASPNPST